MSNERVVSRKILVDSAHTIGSIAVIRSLGRAGHEVHACSPLHDALGFKSNFTDRYVVSPNYGAIDFLSFLREYVRENEIAVIIPSEGFLLAIRDHFSEFSSLLPFSTDKSVVYRGLSKWDLFDHLARQGVDEHLPPYQLIDLATGGTAVPNSHSRNFLKFDELHKKPEGQVMPGVIESTSPEQCAHLIEAARPHYHKALIQDYVSGVGCGVFFLVWDEQVVAQFMHLREHEVPHTGGASSLRKSWWNQEIYDDALKKVKSLAWQGVVMVEYRWNPDTGTFYLMEMNCRFWGSLHLAIYAGVDFPRLLLECHYGKIPAQTIVASPDPVACRYTFPRDVQYVWSLYKDSQVSRRRKRGAILEFFLLFFSRRTKSDLWFSGDRFLYIRRLYRFIKSKGG